jgi:hypothetical protein
VLPVDLTSTWIPLSLLAVLCAYMFVLFQRERRASLAFDGAEATMATGGGHDIGHTTGHTEAPVGVPAVEHAVPTEQQPAPAQPHAAPASAAPEQAHEKKKRKLIWRTAGVWLPFIVGFAAQAYLDIVKPLVEKAAG